MVAEYQCPKCGGTDLYTGNKTIMGGIGGIYGNKSKDVLRHFCRTCDIEALPINSKQEGSVMIVPFSLIFIGLLWIFIFFISSGRYPLGAATPIDISNWNLIIGFGLFAIGFASRRRKLK
jgi:hypothetical protein